MTQTQDDPVTAPKKRARSWWYPWIFVAFFAVIITVNGIMMFFAYSSWTGLETEGHYRKGLAYDDNVQGAKKQAALGWDVSLSVEIAETHASARTLSYKVTFLDHNQKPLDSLKAHTFFIRPTHEGLDVDGPAVVVSPGVVGGEITVPVPGQWDVRVHAESLGRKYQYVERIVVK